MRSFRIWRNTCFLLQDFPAHLTLQYVLFLPRKGGTVTIFETDSTPDASLYYTATAQVVYKSLFGGHWIQPKPGYLDSSITLPASASLCPRKRDHFKTYLNHLAFSCFLSFVPQLQQPPQSPQAWHHHRVLPICPSGFLSHARISLLLEAITYACILSAPMRVIPRWASYTMETEWRGRTQFISHFEDWQLALFPPGY